MYFYLHESQYSLVWFCDTIVIFLSSRTIQSKAFNFKWILNQTHLIYFNYYEDSNLNITQSICMCAWYKWTTTISLILLLLKPFLTEIKHMLFELSLNETKHNNIYLKNINLQLESCEMAYAILYKIFSMLFFLLTKNLINWQILI